jgi:hypothetical protein
MILNRRKVKIETERLTLRPPVQDHQAARFRVRVSWSGASCTGP